MNIYETVWYTISQIIPKLLLFSAILLQYWIAAHLVRLFMLKVLSKLDLEIVRFMQGIVKYAILGFGVTSALSQLGLDLTAIIAGLGITGFALGYAMKDIISNLLSGMLLIVFRTLKRNDIVKIGSYEGRVDLIDLRYTIILGNEEKYLIPNSKLFSEIITIKKELGIQDLSREALATTATLDSMGIVEGESSLTEI